jgi:hypothetical protein
MAMTYVNGSEQDVTADDPPGAIDLSALGSGYGPYVVAIAVPTSAGSPVSLVNAADASAPSGVQFPVPSSDGTTIYSPPLGSGDTPHLYSASSCVCRVSLLRVQ